MPLPGLGGAAAERYGATPSSAGGPMPYRFNEPRRHKIPRARYWVQNWPEYDRALQRRGELTVWVTPEAIAAWCPPRTGRRGRPRDHLVAWTSGVDALSPTRVPGYAVRTYSGRPSSSIRFSTSAAIATSVACRPSVRKRRPSPMTRFHREMSASTRARELYPEVFCQPRRPRSAIHRRCASRCVGAVSAALLGTAFARGGTTTAASGWRAATSA